MICMLWKFHHVTSSLDGAGNAPLVPGSLTSIPTNCLIFSLDSRRFAARRRRRLRQCRGDCCGATTECVSPTMELVRANDSGSSQLIGYRMSGAGEAFMLKLGDGGFGLLPRLLRALGISEALVHDRQVSPRRGGVGNRHGSLQHRAGIVQATEARQENSQLIGGEKVSRFGDQRRLEKHDGLAFGNFFLRAVHRRGRGTNLSQAMQRKRGDGLIAGSRGQLFLGVGQI